MFLVSFFHFELKFLLLLRNAHTRYSVDRAGGQDGHGGGHSAYGAGTIINPFVNAFHVHSPSLALPSCPIRTII